MIEIYAVFSFSLLLQKLQKTVSTKAQQNKSASKNRYKILNPFEAIAKAIIESTTIKYFERFKKLVFLLRLKVALPSTTIKLDIAFTKVSTVLIVKDSPSITIIIDKSFVCSLNNKEKKPKSGTTFGLADIATFLPAIFWKIKGSNK